MLFAQLGRVDVENQFSDAAYRAVVLREIVLFQVLPYFAINVVDRDVGTVFHGKVLLDVSNDGCVDVHDVVGLDFRDPLHTMLGRIVDALSGGLFGEIELLIER